MIEKLVVFIGISLFSTFVVVCLFEFAAGCGEYYIDAKGAIHVNECIIIK